MILKAARQNWTGRCHFGFRCLSLTIGRTAALRQSRSLIKYPWPPHLSHCKTDFGFRRYSHKVGDGEERKNLTSHPASDSKAFAPPASSEAANRTSISTEVRREVWRRDEGRCLNCGSQNRLEFDHIIPVAMGGSNTTRNIQLLCEECNREKGATLG